MNGRHRRLSAEATPSQGPTPLQLKSQAALIGLINAVVSVPTMISYGPIIFQVLLSNLPSASCILICNFSSQTRH